MTFLGPDTVTILAAVGFATVVLGAGGLLTEIGPWYAALRKPSWQPPDWLFGPAWTLIGLLTVLAAVAAWKAMPGQHGLILALFVVNGALNIGWSVLFFKLRRPDWALLEVVGLWLSILAPIVVFAPASATAAWLMVPYLVWVSFASVLTWKIVKLNQPFQRLAVLRNRKELGS